MFAPNRKKGTVQFSIKPPMEAAAVYLAGGWRGWKPVPMKKQQDGRFVVDVRLASGTHEYKFVIDGQWMPDPDHDRFAPNPYGSVNSVAQVE